MSSPLPPPDDPQAMPSPKEALPAVPEQADATPTDIATDAIPSPDAAPSNVAPTNMAPPDALPPTAPPIDARPTEAMPLADMTPTDATTPVSEVYPGQAPAQPWQGYPTGQPYLGYPPTMPPSQPYPPQGYPGAPSQPWMGYPPTGQPLPWPDGAGGVATLAPPQSAASGRASLAQPLPLWALLAGSLVVVLVLVGVMLLGKDWADGVIHVGIATGVLAVLVILATGVRSALGMAAATNEHRRAQYIGAVVVMVVLLVISGLGIGLQAPIHNLQAGVLVSGQQWQQAIAELQQAGETPPASEALARVYNEWGEYLAASQQYQTATDKFFVVLDTYSAATQGVKRAQAGVITTFIGWGKQEAQQYKYQSATQHFDFVLNQPYCAPACQAQVSALDATAYYNLAEADISAQKYTDAITAFGIILARFATAPEAHQLHGDYAVALYQAGQQDIANATTCPAAIPLYQQLTKSFTDTPQAAQAAAALAAPQSVKGQFPSGPPADNIGIASLLKNARIDIKTQDFIGAPTLAAATLIKSDGSFTFTGMPQDTYALAWQTFDKSGNETSYSFFYVIASGDPYYPAKVGPLCAFDFGAIAEPVFSPTNKAVFKQQSVVQTVLAGHSVLVTLIGVPASRQRRFLGVS